MIETWTDIIGFEGYYQVSTLGNIKMIRKANRQQRLGIKRGSKSGRGYLSIVLKSPTRTERQYIHRIVASHFLPNQMGLPTVNHINGNKLDNSTGNLEWASYKDNNRHAVEVLGFNKRGSNNSMAKLTDATVLSVRRDYASGMSQADLHRKYQLTRPHICDLVNNKKWKHLNN